MQGIGLFGGSFNPPHKAHLYISKTAIVKLKLAKLFWLVVPQNPFKKEAPLEQKKRIDLCAKLIGKNNKIKAIDFESDLKSYETCNTIKKAKRVFAGKKLFFVMGSDNLPTFHKWKNPRYIAQNAQIVVFVRGNFHKHLRSISFYKYKPIVIYGKKINISSTIIRNSLGLNWPLKL